MRHYLSNVKFILSLTSLENKTKGFEMELIVKELGLNSKNIFPTSSTNLCAVVVHNTWLKKWLKNLEVDNSVNNVDFTLQPGESVPYPYRKIFIRVCTESINYVNL